MKVKDQGNKNYCGIPLQQALVCIIFHDLIILGLYVVHRQPYLLVFCESNLEVYNVETSEWTQTISIKKVTITLIISLRTFLEFLS